jgi:TetR/AcrR family transcriptional regulator, cholesterol catabolism regulator
MGISQMSAVAFDPDAQQQVFGRAGDSETRRRALIHSAAILFEQKSFHGTSMQDIADAVGITKAALYHYVKSKEELLYEIHDAFVSSMLVDANAFFEQNDDPREQLRFIIRSILTTIVDYRPYVTAFFQDLGALSGVWKEKIHAKRSAYEKFVEACLEKGVEDGVFVLPRQDCPASFFIFGACNWAYQWYRADGPLDVDALVDCWYRLLVFGLRGEGPKK